MPRLAIATALALVVLAAPAAAQPVCTSWKLTGAETFKFQDTLMRSQGVTSDGHGWTFSWQGGLERTTDQFVPTALGTLPVQRDDPPTLDPATGHVHIGGEHIGDVDTDGGLIYAPVEDGNQSAGPVDVNDPEYQAPHIALYDARTLLYTGKSYDVPLSTNGDGVPWIAIDHKKRELYTGEWGMPHDRLNVFDMQMHFKRFLPLSQHLSRIQGAEIRGHTMYASRDDADKTIFAIDLRTGVVTKLFSLNPPVQTELEGIAVRPTPDGALLHVLAVENNNLPDDAAKIDVKFEHFGCAA